MKKNNERRINISVLVQLLQDIALERNKLTFKKLNYFVNHKEEITDKDNVKYYI